MTTDGRLKVTTIEDGRVLRIEIDHPKGNVLDIALMTDLKHVLDGHQDDRRLKLVLLCAAGRHFSFGVSVKEHDRAQAPIMLEVFHTLLRRIAGYPVPIAALVQGQCLGGGFELALCCHFVLAARTAQFACPEIKLAVFPPVLAAVGALRLGGALAERLLLTGESIDVETAERTGLITRTVSTDNAERDALAWYREALLPLSACGLRHATRAVREASGLLDQLGAPLRRAETAYINELLRTQDANEGIASFVEGRAPDWEDA